MAALLGWVWFPSDARACLFPTAVSSIVPTADEHPANGAVVLLGSGLSPDALTATVDGHDVDIVVDLALAMGDDAHQPHRPSWSILPLRFEPEPTPGQTVSVTGEACDSPSCEVEVTYVASDADLTIADATPTLGIDLVRRSTIDEGSCGPEGSLVIARVEADETAFADEALVLCEVVARHDEAGLEAVTRRPMPGSTFDQSVFFSGIVAEGFPLDGWCVDVRMIDVAGNTGTVASSCEACMFYEGDLSYGLDAFPLEPIPGGSCDQGGCSCATTPQGAPHEGWLVVVVVTGLFRRRRAHESERPT